MGSSIVEAVDVILDLTVIGTEGVGSSGGFSDHFSQIVI